MGVFNCLIAAWDRKQRHKWLGCIYEDFLSLVKFGGSDLLSIKKTSWVSDNFMDQALYRCRI